MPDLFTMFTLTAVFWLACVVLGFAFPKQTMAFWRTFAYIFDPWDWSHVDRRYWRRDEATELRAEIRKVTSQLAARVVCERLNRRYGGVRPRPTTPKPDIRPGTQRLNAHGTERRVSNPDDVIRETMRKAWKGAWKEGST